MTNTALLAPQPRPVAAAEEVNQLTNNAEARDSSGQGQLRLLHVVTVPVSLNFFRGQIGYLRSHGFEVQAATSPGEEADFAREREGILVHEVPMNRGISPLRISFLCGG